MALELGLANGDVFSRVTLFSGFLPCLPRFPRHGVESLGAREGRVVPRTSSFPNPALPRNSSGPADSRGTICWDSRF